MNRGRGRRSGNFNDFQRPNFRNQRNNNYSMYDEYGQGNCNQGSNFYDEDDMNNYNSFPPNRSMFNYGYAGNGNPGQFGNMRGYQNNGFNSAPFRNRNQFKNPQFNFAGQFKNKTFNTSITKKTNPKSKLKIDKIGTMKKTVPKKKVEDENDDNILTPDKEPTSVMQGRMEFAVGLIIKEFKRRHKGDALIDGCLEIPFFERMVKDVIRNRVTQVMMNKKIENYQLIIDAYEKEYSFEYDEDILKIVKEEKIGCLEDKMENLVETDTDDPKKFFRLNMLGLVEKSVNELMSNVERFYVNREKEILDLIDDLPDIESENTSMDANESTGNAEKNDDSNANTGTQISGTNGNTHGTNGDANGEVDEEFQRRYQKMQAYMHVTDLILKERLPKMFNDCKYKIVKMITGKDFKLLQADICLLTKSLIAKCAKDKQNQNASQSFKTPPEQLKPPFYAMLLGTPNLPESDILYNFIRQFNPMFIKKHKTNSNLLVIKIHKKKDFINFLEADGHCIGDITFSIKQTTSALLKNTMAAYIMIDEDGNITEQGPSEPTETTEKEETEKEQTNESMETDDVVIIG